MGAVVGRQRTLDSLAAVSAGVAENMTASVPQRATSQFEVVSCHTREQRGGNSEYHRIGADRAPAGFSRETADRENATHGLPKLRTRVRFPSPALGKHRRSNSDSAGLHTSLCLRRTVVVPLRVSTCPSVPQRGARSQLHRLRTRMKFSEECRQVTIPDPVGDTRH
jgi:hypothetical protein